MASYIDLYPTLCDLAGLPPPSLLQGHSLQPILQDPATEVNPYVYARWGKGETIISQRFNYTEYREPATGRILSRMLYDRAADPAENINVVGRPEFRETVATLSAALSKHLADRRRDSAVPLP